MAQTTLHYDFELDEAEEVLESLKAAELKGCVRTNLRRALEDFIEVKI